MVRDGILQFTQSSSLSHINAIGRNDQAHDIIDFALATNDHQLVFLDAEQLACVDRQSFSPFVKELNDCL